MCGSQTSKPLRTINNETIISRTIRLLRGNGIKDIAISTNDDRYLQYGLPVLRHDNPRKNFCWLNAFYPVTEPTCFICGDVFFSPGAIETIVQTETEDIEFFASAPPYSPLYIKEWAEPFAFKVMDVKRFFRCVDQTKAMASQFKRHPISWELWQVIKGTPINHIDYTNYVVINDYTVDVDTEGEAEQLADIVGAL